MIGSEFSDLTGSFQRTATRASAGRVRGIRSVRLAAS